LAALNQQVSGQKTVEVIGHELDISQSTFFKWKKKYGGMTASEAK
jgi:putative transposase